MYRTCISYLEKMSATFFILLKQREQRERFYKNPTCAGRVKYINAWQCPTLFVSSLIRTLRAPFAREKSLRAIFSLRSSRTRNYKQKPSHKGWVFVYKCLAVSYFHMGKPHTIIGAKCFHF